MESVVQELQKKHFQSCQQAPSMENEICVNITGEIVVEDQLGFNMVSSSKGLPWGRYLI